MNESQLGRQAPFLFFGGGIGSLAFLLVAFLFGWHNEFLRLALVAVGFIVGLVTGGEIYTRFFDEDDNPRPHTNRFLTATRKLAQATGETLCSLGLHDWRGRNPKRCWRCGLSK